MLLNVRRTDFTKFSSIGDFSINGEKFCYSLEDKYRADGIKVYGKTAIPCGTYKVVIDWSNRFKRLMPHILDVPGFTGIRIHKGNTAEDTEGCILLGRIKDEDWVGESKAVFDAFFEQLKVAVDNHEKVTITVENA
jgi:Family of unknown function (DUF5675)